MRLKEHFRKNHVVLFLFLVESQINQIKKGRAVSDPAFYQHINFLK